jgi:hypothetical protein
LVFTGTNAGGLNGLDATIKSLDRGLNWTQISNTYEFISLNIFNDQIFFARDEIMKELFKTTNAGISFHLVDSSKSYWEKQYHYDTNKNHIYRVIRNFHTNNYELKVSSNGGEVFTWETKYSSPNQLFISNNTSQTGEIYLSNKKNIFLSTNYGNNFSLYKSLDRNIVGIYKKPNSNKLYAATKYRIYEITPDTILVIKNLPIPDELLSFYPLEIGNKWIYDETTVVYDPYPNYYHRILVKEVIGDTVAPNGKKYFSLRDETVWQNFLFERIDSLGGKVYRYDETLGIPDNEYIIDDLLAEVGDTVYTYRMGYHPGSHTTVLDEITFEKWGLIKPKKVFEHYILHPPVYSLTQDIGLDSIHSYFDFGDTWIVLKGCILDGVVYGDTTVVSVEDEEVPVVSKFKLEQNFPNPFNPTTTIKYQIPELSFVTLKVYDVLGSELEILVSENKPVGSYEIEFNATGLPSGIYFYRLQAGSFVETKKMILLK